MLALMLLLLQNLEAQDLNKNMGKTGLKQHSQEI